MSRVLLAMAAIEPDPMVPGSQACSNVDAGTAQGSFAFSRHFRTTGIVQRGIFPAGRAIFRSASP